MRGQRLSRLAPSVEKRNPLKCVLNFILTPRLKETPSVFNRFLFSFSSSPTHVGDWHLIFRVVKVRKCEIMQ